jgi:hypothetical protein
MTETPKTKLHINPKYSRGYKLNPEKLKRAPQSVLPYFVGAFYYTEDYEYFDVIKPYLDIPEPRKSLEEISQELDEKFEKLIERTKNSFYKSKYIAETLYETKFNRIIENFEYAKEHGHFPVKLEFTVGTGLSWNNPTTSFEIRCGTNHAGYYTIGAGNVRYYMNEKPNWLVRNCAKIFFDFTWKDTP